MDAWLLVRAVFGQLLAVAALFGLLLALPLSEDFFRENGAVIGPLSWLLASLITGRVLSLDGATILRGAVAGGAVAGLIGLLVSHTLGLVLGVVVFGVAVGARRGRRFETASAAGSP